MKFGIKIFLIAAGSIFSLGVLAFEMSVDNKIKNIRLADFTVEKARITEVVGALARASGVGICVEEGRWFNRKGDSDAESNALEIKRKQGITLKTKDATVEEILNSLIKAAPYYHWEIDEVTKTVNVYPAKDAPLNWKIENLAIDNKTVREVFVSKDVLGLGEHGIIFNLMGGNLSWLDSKISINANAITVRKALNLLCSQLNFKARWELVEHKTGSDEVFHVLMIRGYGIAPEESRKEK